VGQQEPTDTHRHESVARHPIHAAADELEHLREVAEDGESAETPAIVGGAVLAFLVVVVAIVITAVFLVWTYA
jgi:hypothetical protein